jgi:hypothetical protein
LGDRRILLIVDDAWREQDLRPFLQGGPNTTRLVTTRIDSVLPQKAIRQPVDAMQKSEALALLAARLPSDQLATESANLAKLAARLGEWAQLLKIVNGFLRDRVVKNRGPLPKAILGTAIAIGETRAEMREEFSATIAPLLERLAKLEGQLGTLMALLEARRKAVRAPREAELPKPQLRLAKP